MKVKSDLSNSSNSILKSTLNKPNRLDTWLKRVLSYPGCDERNLYVNTLSWKATVFILIYSPVFIAGLLLFAPQAILYIQYSYFVFGLMAGSLFMHHVFKKHILLTQVAQNVAFQFITFYFILKLGG